MGAAFRIHDEEVMAERAFAPLVAALDVGVSKTVCLAARRDPVLDMHPGKPMRVLGVGVQSAPAIASGKAADFDACARAVRVAIDEAAYMAGSPITRVVASYAGPGLNARVARGTVRIKGKTITDRDLENAINAASQELMANHLAQLHVEPLRYAIDDGAPLLDPVGMSGKYLSVDACIVTAPADAIQALRQCVRQAGADVEEIVAAPQAAGLATLTDDERSAGALVLDFGAGALGVAVFAAEGLVHAESVPVGGVRLTRDLATKLQTSFAAAERVKLAYGCVGSGFDPREAIQAQNRRRWAVRGGGDFARPDRGNAGAARHGNAARRARVWPRLALPVRRGRRGRCWWAAARRCRVCARWRRNYWACRCGSDAPSICVV